jgi:hypothetical protein
MAFHLIFTLPQGFTSPFSNDAWFYSGRKVSSRFDNLIFDLVTNPNNRAITYPETIQKVPRARRRPTGVARVRNDKCRKWSGQDRKNPTGDMLHRKSVSKGRGIPQLFARLGRGETAQGWATRLVGAWRPYAKPLAVK